jgi:hypothetical protein
VKYALQKRGYSRRIALRKPPISESNRVARLAWAHEHLHWTEEQWNRVLWTDETWVNPGRHRKTWITRKPGEEYKYECLIDRLPKKIGWMFWGSFSGCLKGPSLFWEKDWGLIRATSYQDHIVPLIHGWIRLHLTLLLMQDGAPGHKAAETKEDLRERGIYPIFWPAYSPDLNPIETVWNRMKDWIMKKYPDYHTSYDRLRIAVKEAWDAIGELELLALVREMPARCQAVIDANGMHTKY